MAADRKDFEDMFRVGTKHATEKIYKFLQSTAEKDALLTVSAAMHQNLPRLPVPQLKQTLDKYLKTVKPHLSESEFQVTSGIVTKFNSGIGKKLQSLLVEKAKSCENWLAEWWLRSAYMGYRSTVVVWSSPGLVFPFQNFHNESERITFTAKLIRAAVSYKQLIDSGKLPVDTMGKDPLDMNQYRKIFGTCRIPGVPSDTLVFHSFSAHIVVVYKNNFFRVDVFNSNGQALSEKQLINQLFQIVQQSTEFSEPVGLLTTQDRDAWSSNYHLLIQDGLNKKSLEEIQQSLFLVCLDEAMPDSDDNRQTTAAKQFIHGGGSAANAGNRWYDKTIQFIVGKEGAAGLTYEHSPSEGQPIAVMTDYIVDYISNGIKNSSSDVHYEGKPKKLEFCFTKKSLKLAEASSTLDKLVQDLDMDCFTFRSFGKEFIKSQKLSPDSFIQIAMQYAFYRIHVQPGAHYESAATRKYIHGRTETIRSCSVESVAFAKLMLNDNATDSNRLQALKEAIQSHKQYSVEAVNGFGVDRHLLGLKLLALENTIEVPELYTDPGYVRSSHMRISSSQVATKCDGFMCYGPLVTDGYGCCYNPRPHDINFAISAFKACPDTGAGSYRHALEESLLDMHNLLLKTQKSKL